METPSPWQDTVFFETGLLCLAGDLWHITEFAVDSFVELGVEFVHAAGSRLDAG